METLNINFTQLIELTDKIGIYFWITEHTSDKVKILTSDSLKALSGYTSEEMNKFPEGIFSIVHEEDIQKVKDQIENIKNDPKINRAEMIYRIVTKENKNIWIKENLYLERIHSGQINRSLSFAVDITDIESENLELKKSLENSQEMNSIKDKFISIVSHDLRAPFTTLLGFTEILMNEQDLSNEEREEYLSYIYDASKSQLQMINHLVDLSRLQTGRTKIEPSRLNIRNTISNCVSILTGIAMRKDIEIKTSIPDDIYINADERLISQAITNLISNSIKFSENGKQTQVIVERFKEGMIEIIIKDEGIGISEENQSKLFKIDFKYSIPGTKGEKGTGLGLALVKEIVEKHEGNIWFYSKLNEGSEFHFTIPEARNIIIIVDDNKKIRSEYRKKILQTLVNFEVIEVDNGYKAINIIQEKIPSAIVINHDMPLMDGIQFVETLRNRSSVRNIPILVIAEKIDEEISKKYAQLKIETLLNAPADPQILIENLKDYIGLF